MKTLHQFTRNGINTLGDLRDALRLAMQLEFATIPPYLSAKWSIKFDPDRVEGVLHHIVGQEMNHLALAGNLLTAIGGKPRIARKGFLPKYPLKELPGGVEQKLPIALKPLSFDQLAVFMQIEYPEFPPVAAAPSALVPATIGEFYDAIIIAFQRIRPNILKNANSVPVILATPILTLDDAISTLVRIKTEGEGLQDSPQQPTSEGSALAHYYLFKEIYRQRRLVETPEGWTFSGSQTAFPEVYDFAKRKKHPLLRLQFRKAITCLLIELDECWRNGCALNLATMFKVDGLGRELVRLGVSPEFRWQRS
ncbi:ferritin-like domain-containing protein [Rhizobium ruizarguesonis]|uniref:ferritin-like domain-containing protein n=1 Tax=Rhizobium ruizarguesonis TaxID=2081791 RepID=UPI00103156D6|nr:ferritin-like protein [Rhizobium ruizarguesonis]TBA12000.1 hypothetical protein ELH65_26665 [Rhizobium ruizarguesonis]